MEKMCRIPALVLHETAIALVGAGRTTPFWHGNRYAGLRPKTCAVARIRRVFAPRLTQSGQIHPCTHQLPPSMPLFGFETAGRPTGSSPRIPPFDAGFRVFERRGSRSGPLTWEYVA